MSTRLSRVCNMLLPGSDAVALQGVGRDITNGINVRVAGLQLAIHLSI